MAITSAIDEAKSVVDGHAKDRDVGKERAMKSVVNVFNALTGKNLTEHDGDIFLVCVKLVRMQRDKKGEDHYVDAIGYLQMAFEAKDKTE
jgi:hypothetical protein